MKHVNRPDLRKEREAKGVPCDFCGYPEQYPVAVERGRSIKWICYRCWKKEKRR